MMNEAGGEAAKRSEARVAVAWVPSGPEPRAVLLPRTRMRRQWSASPGPGGPSLSAPLSLEPAGLEAEVPAVSLGLRPPPSARKSSAPPRSPLRPPPPPDSARRAGPRSRSAPPSPMPAATAASAAAAELAWAGLAAAPRPSRPPPDRASAGPAPARLLLPSLLIGPESGLSESRRLAPALRLGVGGLREEEAEGAAASLRRPTSSLAPGPAEGGRGGPGAGRNALYALLKCVTLLSPTPPR